jgi:hypothetical protein
MIGATVEEIYAPGTHGTEPIAVPPEIGTFVFPGAGLAEIPALWQSALNSVYAAMGVEREPYVGNGSGVIGNV